MNCPYCGSTHLEEASNFNEFDCKFCKCNFKSDGKEFRVFDEGNYKKFCENVMYHLCEEASPKVSNVLVSVISQLKNNGIEEIDTIIEHLQLVASNVSSEIAIGLQTEADLSVVKEGIEHFTNIGNALLKRDDLELDLSRFIRFNEAKEFFEKTYISAIDTPLVKGFKKGAVEEETVPTVPTVDPVNNVETTDETEPEYHDDNVRATADFKHHEGEITSENEMDGLPPVDTGTDPVGDIKPPLGVPPEGISPEDEALANQPNDIPPGGEQVQTDGVIGGVSDNLPGALDDVGDVDDQPPFEEMSNAMFEAYNSGELSKDADFFEALLTNKKVNEIYPKVGSLTEEQAVEIAEKVQQKLDEATNVSPEQIQEALEILTKSIKLEETELKDL